MEDLIMGYYDDLRSTIDMLDSHLQELTDTMMLQDMAVSVEEYKDRIQDAMKTLRHLENEVELLEV